MWRRRLGGRRPQRPGFEDSDACDDHHALGSKRDDRAERGNASFSLQGPGAIPLQFKNFVKSGDLVSFTLNTEAKAIRQVKVDTYLDDADKDKAGLQVDFQTLPDGTNYAASKVLNVEAKKIVVNISAANYQQLAQ